VTVLLVAAVVAVAVDAASKSVATSVLVEGRLYALAPGWGVRLVTNTRMRLSVAQAAVLLAVVVGAVLAAGPTSVTALGLGMAIGGAAGNIVDRIRRGGVVDFVAAGRWPVFNLADAAMTIGLLLAVVSVL
jgi:signal peptidase II